MLDGMIQDTNQKGISMQLTEVIWQLIYMATLA